MKVDITDHGIGIEPAEQGAVFRRFHRAKNASAYPGMGLGLHLAKLIVEKQGGYITVASEPGEYTTFSVYISQDMRT
jgi:signal transduction histidine kinase